MIVAAFAAFITVVFAISYFGTRSASKSTHSGAAIESIAILPFNSLSPEAGDEYLAVGMADTLSARLGNTGRIIVRPFSAMRGYANETQDPITVGREQQVDAIVDGSFHKSEGRIRVSARLINTRDGASLWSGSFDEKDEDQFRLQDSIVKELATALALKLTTEEERRLVKHYTESAEAAEAHAIGRFWWNRRDREGFNQAIKFYNKAIALDRNYALPYVGLADCYALMSPYGIAGPEESYPKAKAAARQALAIDNQLAEAHTSLAHITWLYDWDFEAAKAEFKQAMKMIGRSDGWRRRTGSAWTIWSCSKWTRFSNLFDPIPDLRFCYSVSGFRYDDPWFCCKEWVRTKKARSRLLLRRQP